MAAAGSPGHGTLGTVRLLLVALLVAAAMPLRAAGDPRDEPPARELCAADVRHHGAAIDLDVRGAGIHDVFRLLANAGRVNLVIADDVTGTVTLHLVHVAWDAAACAIASVHHLRIDVQGNILVVASDRTDRRGAYGLLRGVAPGASRRRAARPAVRARDHLARRAGPRPRGLRASARAAGVATLASTAGA